MKNFISGKFINQGSYKSFQPNFINQQWTIDDPDVLDLLSRADRQLGRLDMFSEYTPNIDLFISMHVAKEATKSSIIEGTQTRIEEVLLKESDIASERRDDWEEVQNYIKSINTAVNRLSDLPFSNRLIKESHKVLLDGVRGSHKLPGSFRSSQNWIGGASIDDSVFVPPVHNTIPELMGDLEKFVHNEEIKVPDLIRIAIIHYQFETIHPFLDGNGRVGRLLITLYLVSKGILKKPLLYLSDFFERNRQLYYDNLMRVRLSNDINQWLRFFLRGILETAENGKMTLDQILKLKQDIEFKIQGLKSRAAGAQLVMESLFRHPVISAKDCAEITGLSLPSSYSLIADLEKMEIIQEATGSKRGKVYFFKQYIDLFR